MQNAKKYLQITLIILIIATVLFIFINSMLPPNASTEQSDAVAEIIGTIIPKDTDFGSFVQQYIRKIAHFTEYGLLGIEIAIYVVLFVNKRLKCALLNILLTPLVVGFVDETIQIFSDRGPSVSDVWIDVGGFVFFSLVAYLILGVIYILTRALRLK